MTLPTHADTFNVTCRFCGGALHDFVDLGMSPLCESFLGADQLNADGAVLSAARLRLPRLLPGAAPGVCGAGRRSSRSTPISRRISDSLARARRRLCRDDRPTGSASARASLVVELAQQRRLSAADFVDRRHPGARHRAGGQRRRSARAKPACRRWSTFFGVETARAARRRRASRPICSSATTCWRRCPTSTTSSPASQIAAEAERRHHDRVPASACG